jgi:hypothetical protein
MPNEAKDYEAIARDVRRWLEAHPYANKDVGIEAILRANFTPQSEPGQDARELAERIIDRVLELYRTPYIAIDWRKIASAEIAFRLSHPADALLDRLRHLTPGGSEFKTADECFAWIEKRLALRPSRPADEAKRECLEELSAVRAERDGLQALYDKACELIGQGKIYPLRAVIRGPEKGGEGAV